MTWLSFVLFFDVSVALLLIGARSLFRGMWSRLVQTVVFVVALTFLIDYPAEARQFWLFGQPNDWTVLDTPIENHFFVAGCSVFILIVYRSLQRYRFYDSH